jgi:hypothetical protein
MPLLLPPSFDNGDDEEALSTVGSALTSIRAVKPQGHRTLQHSREDDACEEEDNESPESSPRSQWRETVGTKRRRTMYDDDKEDKNEKFWNPPQVGNHNMIDRTVFVRGKPNHMTADDLKAFLDQIMQQLQLCPPGVSPILHCRPVRKSDKLCALLLKNKGLAIQALSLNGIAVPKATCGVGSGATTRLQVFPHSKASHPSSSDNAKKQWRDVNDRTPNFEAEGKGSVKDQAEAEGDHNEDTSTASFATLDPNRFKRIFVGNLPANVTAPNLVKFLERNLQKWNLLPPEEEASAPVIDGAHKKRGRISASSEINCTIHWAKDRTSWYACLFLESVDKGQALLHLDGIPFMKQKLDIKVFGGLRNPPPKRNWNDLQDEWHQKLQKKETDGGNLQGPTLAIDPSMVSAMPADNKGSTTGAERSASHIGSPRKSSDNKQVSTRKMPGKPHNQHQQQQQEQQQRDQRLIVDQKQRYDARLTSVVDLENDHQQGQKLTEDWKEKYDMLWTEHMELKRNYQKSQRVMEEGKHNYDKLQKDHMDLKREHQQSQKLRDEFKHKCDKLQEENTDLLKDYRRISQSLASFSEQRGQVENLLHEEIGRRREAERNMDEEHSRRQQVEHDLQRLHSKYDRLFQDTEAELRHHEQLLQQEQERLEKEFRLHEEQLQKEVRRLQEEIIKQHRDHRAALATVSPPAAVTHQQRQQQQRQQPQVSQATEIRGNILIKREHFGS